MSLNQELSGAGLPGCSQGGVNEGSKVNGLLKVEAKEKELLKKALMNRVEELFGSLTASGTGQCSQASFRGAA